MGRSCDLTPDREVLMGRSCDLTPDLEVLMGRSCDVITSVRVHFPVVFTTRELGLFSPRVVTFTSKCIQVVHTTSQLVTTST